MLCDIRTNAWVISILYHIGIYSRCFFRVVLCMTHPVGVNLYLKIKLYNQDVAKIVKTVLTRC